MRIGRDEESKEGILGNQGALSLRPQLFPKHTLYIAGFDFVVVVVLFCFILLIQESVKEHIVFGAYISSFSFHLKQCSHLLGILKRI